MSPHRHCRWGLIGIPAGPLGPSQPGRSTGDVQGHLLGFRANAGSRPIRGHALSASTVIAPDLVMDWHQRGRAHTRTGSPGARRTSVISGFGVAAAFAIRRPRPRSRRRLDRPSWGSTRFVPQSVTPSRRARLPRRSTAAVPATLEVPFDDRSRGHQRLRPHRPPVAQGADRARPGRRGRRRQRPRRRRRPTPSCSSTTRPTAPTRARSATPTTPSSSTARRSRSSRSPTRRSSRGATSASTSSSSRPAASPTRRRPRPTSTPARRRSSSAPRPRARTSRSSWASTRTSTTPRSTTSSATPAAPRTAWRRRPRWSTTTGSSSAA